MRKEDQNTGVVWLIVSAVIVLCIVALIGLGSVIYAPEIKTPSVLQNQSGPVGEMIRELEGEAKLVAVIQQADADLTSELYLEYLDTATK